MQLDKILQSQGFGNRKACQLLIKQGHIKVNGETCSNANAQINTEGLLLTVGQLELPYYAQVYIALNKAQGVECSQNPQRHRSVFDLFPYHLRTRGLQSVGRLDQDSTGLLLLTDDGKYLHALTHPRRHVPKRYLISTARPITPEQIQALSQGVALHGETGLFAADQIEQHDERQLSLTIHQGIYHQVKRMLAAVGNHVNALERTQIGGLCLQSLHLAQGEWCYLTAEQVVQAAQSGDGLNL
jgi:16S rRNA pseudouridine516 synthase